MIDLYQLPISHYCEKARWALDYKRLDWRPRNLLPGMHVKTARRLTGQTSLPILVHDDHAINESSRIVDYLDERFPERPLTPEDQDLRRQALDWERIADQDIGIHVRRIAYHELLERPDVVIPLLTHRGPWYGRFLLRRIFPQLRARMRQYMAINDESTARSRDDLAVALGRVEAGLAGRDYLVGDRFTRADLAVAALLAPLTMPPEYGMPWPAVLPPALAAVAARHVSVLAWVQHVYDRHRKG